jgi:hypothetical protein
VSEILGIAGITISMLVYVPQVVHLGKEQLLCGDQPPRLGYVARG